MLVIIFATTILPAAPVRVACVGDSITYGLRLIDRKKDCYPAVLQRLLGDGYEVRNFGASSATVQESGNRPYTRKAVYQESLAWQPDIVLLLLGTNDSKKKNWEGVDSYMDAMRKTAASYKNLPSDPHIYVMTPPKAFSGYAGINDSHIKEESEAILAQTDYPVIDLRAAFEDNRQLIGKDGIHPNKEGAREIATRIAKTLQHGADLPQENEPALQIL